MLKIEGEIYCEVHGTIHEAISNPYQYAYEDDEEPECSSENWRVLWAGRHVLEDSE